MWNNTVNNGEHLGFLTKWILKANPDRFSGRGGGQALPVTHYIPRNPNDTASPLRNRQTHKTVQVSPTHSTAFTPLRKGTKWGRLPWLFSLGSSVLWPVGDGVASAATLWHFHYQILTGSNWLGRFQVDKIVIMWILWQVTQKGGNLYFPMGR